MNENFSIDMAQVNANLQIIIENKIPGLAADGLFRMAEDLLNDATNIEPTTPKGRYRAKAGKRTGVGGALRQSGRIEKQTDGSLLVGFNMPYATYVHEGQRSDGTRVIQNWSEPGSGKEFLKKKLEMFKDAYLKRLADYIGERGGA